MNEKRCGLPSVVRYTWPGNEEKYACAAHALQLLAVAEALGFELQMIRLESSEMSSHPCSQNERG